MTATTEGVPLARLATVWFVDRYFHWPLHGSNGDHFSTSFLEVPSEPKRDFNGDVATSKSLIGSAKTSTAISWIRTVPGVRGKLWLGVIAQAKLFCPVEASVTINAERIN